MVHQISPLELWSLIAIFAALLAVIWFSFRLIPKILFRISKRLLARKIDRHLRVLRKARDEISNRQ